MTYCVIVGVQDDSTAEWQLCWKYQPRQLGKREIRCLIIGKEVKIINALKRNLNIKQKNPKDSPKIYRNNKSIVQWL